MGPLVATSAISTQVEPLSRWNLVAQAEQAPFSLYASNGERSVGKGFLLSTGQRLLHGPSTEVMLLGGCRIQEKDGIVFLDDGVRIGGYGQVKANFANLEAATSTLYRKILRLGQGKVFCRFWNYVPDINHVESGRLENYRQFCSGRSHAFADINGQNRADLFPAASATGTADGHLSVVFLATRSCVHNWENPEQIPAYQYPSKYGPLPPSFARASQFTEPSGKTWTFISGTAAIKGHKSQHAGDFRSQVEVTLDNIDRTLRCADMRLVQTAPRPRHFKVFLRNADDLPVLLERLHPLIGVADTLTVVEGDICREDLDVEIEITVQPDRLAGTRSAVSDA